MNEKNFMLDSLILESQIIKQLRNVLGLGDCDYESSDVKSNYFEQLMNIDIQPLIVKLEKYLCHKIKSDFSQTKDLFTLTSLENLIKNTFNQKCYEINPWDIIGKSYSSPINNHFDWLHNNEVSEYDIYINEHSLYIIGLFRNPWCRIKRYGKERDDDDYITEYSYLFFGSVFKDSIIPWFARDISMIKENEYKQLPDNLRTLISVYNVNPVINFTFKTFHIRVPCEIMNTLLKQDIHIFNIPCESIKFKHVYIQKG